MLNITTLQLYILILYQLKGEKVRFFLLILQLCITIKGSKTVFFLTVYDWICQFSMPAHYVRVQNAENTSNYK